MKRLSSRPDEGAKCSSFTNEELELIGALMYNVRLGYSSKYQTAAKTIMDKIEDHTHVNFLTTANMLVDPHVELLDSSGFSVMRLPGSNYEIVV